MASLSPLTARALRPNPSGSLPEVKGDFAASCLMASDCICALVKRFDDAGRRLIVISNVPVTTNCCAAAAAQLGSVSTFCRRKLRPVERLRRSLPPPHRRRSLRWRLRRSIHRQCRTSPSALRPGPLRCPSVSAESRATVSLSNESGRVEAGQVPPAVNSFDFQFPFATRFNAIDWQSGKIAGRPDAGRYPALDAVQPRCSAPSAKSPRSFWMC